MRTTLKSSCLPRETKKRKPTVSDYLLDSMKCKPNLVAFVSSQEKVKNKEEKKNTVSLRA